MQTTVRNLVIYWLYSVAAVHVLVGVLLPWIGNLTFLESYHRSIESAFWPTHVPDGARALHVWWLSLFGPTIQTLGIWMGALIYLGARYRSSIAWLLLFLGFAVWAPQDILVSLRANAWIHVWVDIFALATVFPPLIYLWRKDLHHELHKANSNE
jgi:hypothetical protein